MKIILAIVVAIITIQTIRIIVDSTDDDDWKNDLHKHR